MKEVRVANFSKYPGGRFIRSGPHSGQEFREKVLVKELSENYCILVNFIGAVTIIPSFIDEAFGPFVEKLGEVDFRSRIHWKADPNSDVEQFIEDTIKNRS